MPYSKKYSKLFFENITMHKIPRENESNSLLKRIILWCKFILKNTLTRKKTIMTERRIKYQILLYEFCKGKTAVLNLLKMLSSLFLSEFG